MDEVIEVRIKETGTKALLIKDIQNLLQWIKYKAYKPRYLGILYKEKIKNINLVFINDYKSKPIIRKPNTTKIIHNKKQIMISEYINNYSVLEGKILDCHDFNTLSKQLIIKSRINLVDLHYKKTKKKSYIPTETRLYEHFYDLSQIKETSVQEFLVKDWRSVYLEQELFVDSSASLYKDFSNLKKLSNKTDNFLVSVDCEMTMSDKGYELGRVSILSHNGKVLYDKIVLPENPITNYLTEYSGLSKESFEDAISFTTAKEEISHIIGSNTIILGHALFNDLNILKIQHEKFIDTSSIYRTKDNHRKSLKILAKNLLQRDIQGDTHCSIEDAMACLELLALKIGEFSDLEGIDYGCDIKICNDIKEMKHDGINFLELSCDDVVPFAESFNLFFYKEGDRLHFLI